PDHGGDARHRAGDAPDGRVDTRVCARRQHGRDRPRRERACRRELARAHARGEALRGRGEGRDRDGRLAARAAPVAVPARDLDRPRHVRRPERHRSLQARPDQAVGGLRLARRRDRAAAEGAPPVSETLDALKLAAIVLVAAILQVAVFGGWEVAGGSPDLLLVAVVAIALLRGTLAGAIVGFFGGLVADTATLGTLGLTSLLLTGAGYWAGRYGETTGRDRSHAPAVSVAVVTVLYALGAVILHVVLGD